MSYRLIDSIDLSLIYFVQVFRKSVNRLRFLKTEQLRGLGSTFQNPVGSSVALYLVASIKKSKEFLELMSLVRNLWINMQTKGQIQDWTITLSLPCNCPQLWHRRWWSDGSVWFGILCISFLLGQSARWTFVKVMKHQAVSDVRCMHKLLPLRPRENMKSLNLRLDAPRSQRIYLYVAMQILCCRHLQAVSSLQDSCCDEANISKPEKCRTVSHACVRY